MGYTLNSLRWALLCMAALVTIAVDAGPIEAQQSQEREPAFFVFPAVGPVLGERVMIWPSLSLGVETARGRDFFLTVSARSFDAMVGEIGVTFPMTHTEASELVYLGIAAVGSNAIGLGGAGRIGLESGRRRRASFKFELRMYAMSNDSRSVTWSTIAAGLKIRL